MSGQSSWRQVKCKEEGAGGQRVTAGWGVFTEGGREGKSRFGESRQLGGHSGGDLKSQTNLAFPGTMCPNAPNP